MVDERHFIAYSFERMPDKEADPSGFDYWRKSQISGAVSIITDILSIYL